MFVGSLIFISTNLKLTLILVYKIGTFQMTEVPPLKEKKLSLFSLETNAQFLQ
jgi:hypothetical protein